MLAETIIKIALNEVLENLTLGYKVAPENVEIDWNPLRMIQNAQQVDWKKMGFKRPLFSFFPNPHRIRI